MIIVALHNNSQSQIKSSDFVLHFQIALEIKGPLTLPVNFKISLSIYLFKHPARILIRTVLN